jgi:hypothetical protein
MLNQFESDKAPGQCHPGRNHVRFNLIRQGIHIELIGFVLDVIPVRHLFDFNIVTYVALKMPLLSKVWPGLTRDDHPFPLCNFPVPHARPRQ